MTNLVPVLSKLINYTHTHTKIGNSLMIVCAKNYWYWTIFVRSYFKCKL